MTQTDKILSTIGAMRTLLENFPMGFFERSGKNYSSSFEFILDVLRSCGINDKDLINYLIGKIYGFEGKNVYTIDGLYDYVKNGNINIDMQNPFISGLETSIKNILMSLFTSIFTCSAIPVFPNGVLDYDSLQYLMTPDIRNITCISEENDSSYKLKIPVSSIDILGMFEIVPSSSDGSLYYSTSGSDIYYHKEYVNDAVNYTFVDKYLSAGEEYETEVKKYKNDYFVNFNYTSDSNVFFTLCDSSSGNIVNNGVPFDLNICVDYTYGNSETSIHRILTIKKNESISENFILYPNLNIGNYEIKSEILGISINGRKKGCEFGIDELSWIYISSTDGINQWKEFGGVEINPDIFGETKNDATIIKKMVADVSGIYNCAISSTTKTLKYISIPNPSKYDISNSIRLAYVPTFVNENDNDYIVCYNGTNPNIIYREYDMNAFLWYCYNRTNFSNQIERNHLMWDSRISASKNGIIRNSQEWNIWYESKSDEGDEFKYDNNPSSEIFYPIIQVERYNDYELLIRIPSQRYFLPKKREEIYNGTYTTGGTYFNSSIYKFDSDYLKNIQLLNPKLLLVRLIEHLLGYSINPFPKFNVNKKRIESMLSKVVKKIITANDMEVEDCWKSFSNEDYDELLNEMILSRYSGESTNENTSKYDIKEYVNKIDKINSNVSSQGTTTMITKTVTDIMTIDGSEESTEFSFEYGFDSNIVNKLIWAVTMPIVESLFTPQVMLLMMINFNLLGIVKTNDFLNTENDFRKIINLLFNKIFGLVKSIVILIKDKIVSLLIQLFDEIIKPILNLMTLLLFNEHITDWLAILLDSVNCIPIMLGFENRKELSNIDDVNYADIVNVQNIPESSTDC